MGGGTHGEHGEKGPPSELAALQRGAVLCDRHRQECYQVRDVDGVGVALH